MATRRELVERALLRRPTARPRCFPLVDVAFASTHSGKTLAMLQLDPRLHATALSRCLRELPIDGVYINICFSARQASEVVGSGKQYSLRLDDCLRLEFSENEVAAIAGSDLVSLDDERIGTAELFHPGMIETFQAMPEEVRNEAAVCVGLTGAFSQVGFLVGRSKPDGGDAGQPGGGSPGHTEGDRRSRCDRRARSSKRGRDLFGLAKAWPSNSLLSARMYADFVLPYERELADEIRRQGALSLLHICGNVTPSLPHIATSRVDGVDIDSPTDWPAAVEVLGLDVCLKGNINPTLFLPGREEELAAACAASKRVVVRAEGFILSTGCLVPRDSSREAFNIMARAALVGS